MSEPITDPAGTPGEPQAEPQAPAAAPSAALTQDDVNRILANERRKWERQAKEQADKAKAEAQGEYQTLYTQEQQRAAQLEAERQTVQEQLEARNAALERHLKARLTALPEELRNLDPGGDVLARYEWLEKAEKAAAKLGATPQNKGTPAGPRGVGTATTGGANPQDLIEQKRRLVGGF